MLTRSVFVPNKDTHMIFHEFHNHSPACISPPASEPSRELLEVLLKENGPNSAHHSRPVCHH